MQDLFDTVREEAASGVWSEGVELARQGAVFGERSDGDEVVVRVRPSGGMIHPTVILYPEDAEWECDCRSDADPCAHVAAAVIAVRRARREGQDLPAAAAEAGGALRYELTETPEGLVFERIVLHGGQETKLRTTLHAATSGKVEAPPVSPTQADVAVELALGPNLHGALPRGVLHALIPALARCSDVRLEGRPIRAVAEPVTQRAVLRDHSEGFLLRVEPTPRVDRSLGDGLALCGDTLRIVAPSRLMGHERESLLGRGRIVPADQVAALVSDVLPGLEERMAVEIETQRLPSARRELPRIELETAREGDGLAVLAKLVYGDPPVARVDAGRLTHLQGAIPIRDEAAEDRLVTQLRARLGLSPGRRVVLGAEEALPFVDRLESYGGRILGDAHRRFHQVGTLVPALSVTGDRLDLRFDPPQTEGSRELSGEAGSGVQADPGAGSGVQADPEAVLRAWRRGEGLVELRGGGFAALPADWLDQHGTILADLLAARRSDGALPGAAAPDLARLCALIDAPEPPSFVRLRTLLDETPQLPDPEIPQDCTAQLRDYQRDGIGWLQFLGRADLGALLADDMGLGKTLQALCALKGRTLVVAPTSLLANWSEEIARFRPALKTSRYHGSGRRIDQDADVTLTTYALLRRDIDSLRAEAWDTVILDEAQAIKNPDSQVARAAFELPAGVRITLTGTPVENRLEELWSQIHFLNPGLLGTRQDFEERYARPIAQGDTDAAEHLKLRIRPFLLRRRKAEVAPELPPRTELVLHCVLSEEERAVYDAVRASTVAEVVRRLEEGGGGGVMAALEALLRLRQACCHPGLLPGQSLDRSSKLELLIDRLDTARADGHKALVFSQWTGLLDKVEPLLREAELPFVRLDGSTRDRGEVVRRFQDPAGPPVFLISLRAGGTGLNLTAADHVFLLDPWWNPAVEEQAADRAHRIGQDRPVFVHRLVAQDTVEERILALQQRKRALAEAVLGEASEAARLSRDDLLALLAD